MKGGCRLFHANRLRFRLPQPLRGLLVAPPAFQMPPFRVLGTLLGRGTGGVRGRLVIFLIRLGQCLVFTHRA